VAIMPIEAKLDELLDRLDDGDDGEEEADT
jgi:hypothetical protein